MRYSIADPVEWEAEDAATTSLLPADADAPADADPGDPAIAAEPEPVVDDDSGIDEPEPPLWRTGDDHVLHLPRRRVQRILRRLQQLRAAGRPRTRTRLWSRFRSAPFSPRRSAGRPGSIGAVGRVIRNARRAGTWRSRKSGSRLPVFRSRAGGRPVRIVTRRRQGMRHEILAIEPELETFDREFETPTVSAAGSVAEQPVAQLAAQWSERRKGNPPVAAMTQWLLRDREDTLAGARSRWARRPYPPETIGRAWAISRAEQMRFQTEPRPGLRSLGRFAPPVQPVSLVSSSLIKDSDKAPVAPLTARFVQELRRRYPKFDVWNYRGHGGGAFNGRGYSLDLAIPGRDGRGFYPPAEAIRFLRAVHAAAGAVGAQWRVLYNDFTVADAVNRERGARHVLFMGTVRRRGATVAGLNWHGPHPLILHFHLDLAPVGG